MNSCPLCASILKVAAIGGKDRLVCVSCEFVHWDNPKPVTATLVPMEGGLVLVKRKFEPFVDDWCLPGGFIEAREHPEESAVREVLEETGLTIELDKLVGAYSPGRNINVIILVYLAKPTNKGILAPGDDASEVKVFRQHETPQNIAFELHRRFIHKWFAGNGSLS